MVAGFTRSFSLPGSPRLKTRPAPQKPYHIRSVSLPCRSNPLISQLEDEIRSIKSWQSTRPVPESTPSAWVCDGLSRLELLHASLHDFLNLPQTQDSLRRGSGSEWAGRVLDDFLRLADAHGRFRSQIVAVSGHQSDAQVAMRRRDRAKLSSCVRCMKKTEKELVKIASPLREVSNCRAPTRFSNGIEEAELAGIIREVIQATVSASTAVLMVIAATSSATSNAVASTTTKSSWLSSKKRSMGVEEEATRNLMERLQGLEECFGAVERRSERVLRCLLNTRVALLSIISC